jgi:hypothetical protein
LNDWLFAYRIIFAIHHTVANIKNILPDKRRITVLVSMIFLLALFLVPYFFVFIPLNASNLKRQAFLKLNRTAQNMISKSNDTRSYYSNTATAPGLIVFDSADMVAAECSTAGKEPLSHPDSVYFVYRGEGWNILFVRNYPNTSNLHTRGHTRVGKDSLSQGDSSSRGDTLTRAHQQPLPEFMATCTASGKEIFESFLLIHYCQRMGGDTAGKIIYQDYQPGMEQDINLDSLIPKHAGMRSPDMNDISLEGTDYKLFTYPFLLGRHRMVLCGLMKTDAYNAQLHAIPVGTSYTLVICLVLFLLSLPFLKIFMMNNRDRIYALNIAIGVAFLFALASFVTIVSTQLILLNQGRTQVKANLDSLSIKLEDSLSAELVLAEKEMAYFDDRLSKYMDSIKIDQEPHDSSPYFLIEIDSNNLDTAFDTQRRILSGHYPIYHDADHIGWISDTGREAVRIKYISNETYLSMLHDNNFDTIQFVNVSPRPYFQELHAHFKYKIPGDSAMLILAPVQSWVSGEFRVNLCRYSKIPKLMVQVMETRLYSMVNTVLPAGYGYCLFDASGNTLIHSDTLKSLRENFLDETGRLPWILGSIKSRQRIQSGSVAFYGTNYRLQIQPLKQHPLFLAVFYNNDYLEPMNLRVLSFSLFFCLLTYLLLYIFFLLLYRREPRTFLFSPMEYYWRIVPSREKFNLYFNGSFLLVGYIAVFSMASIFSPWIGFELDYTILVLGLLTPFIGLYTLWLLQRRMGTLNRTEAKKYVWPVYVSGLAVYTLSYFAEWPLEPLSYFIMIAVIAWLVHIIVIRKRRRWIRLSAWIRRRAMNFTRWSDKGVEEKKLFSYSAFVTLFIYAIAVLPVLEYSWYAYSHELRQSVKKEQLEIADGIQKREKNIQFFLRNNQPNFKGDDDNFRTIQYHRGIYPSYSNRVSPAYDSTHDPTEIHTDYDNRSESFYLAIAGTFNLFYKDPAGLPPLYDSYVQDNLYHWYMGRDSGTLNFAKGRWKIPPALGDTTTAAYNFKIISRLPSGLRIDPRLRLSFLAMLIGLLLAIYWIVKTIARQIYLTKIVSDAGSGLSSRYAGNGNGFWGKCLPIKYDETGEKIKNKTIAEHFLSDLKSEYDQFELKKNLILFESAIVAKTGENGAIFECVWNALDDKEKYLLYCMANDGLLNQKNESVIYDLLNKNLLVIFNQRVRLVSYSFRQFIISRSLTPEEKKLFADLQSGATWANLRTIVLVIIMSVFIFLFLTQQEVSAKIIALITSLSALLPFLLKLGLSPSPSGEDKK